MLNELERRVIGAHLPPGAEEAIANYDKGCALKALKLMPGWKHLLDIMEAHCAEAESRLLDTDETDLQRIAAFQKEARATRKFFHEVQAVVESFIQETQAPPEMLQHIQEIM